MSILTNFIYSTLATIGFSVFLHIPTSSLIPAGLSGGIGWTLFIVLDNASYNPIFSNFLASFVVSLFSEILARKLKQPATLFVIPGVIPLVPGLGMYNTMLYLVQGNFDLAISTGANVIFVGAAISLGVLIVTSLSKTIRINIRK